MTRTVKNWFLRIRHMFNAWRVYRISKAANRHGLLVVDTALYAMARERVDGLKASADRSGQLATLAHSHAHIVRNVRHKADLAASYLHYATRVIA